MRVLLVEDNVAEARLVQETLHETRSGAFEVRHVTRLAEALAALGDESPREGRPEVVLLDLGLPDSGVGETYAAVRAAAPDVPVVALSGLDDEERAAQTVREGAQDYLIKGRADGELVARALRYAVERGAARREHELRVAAEARRAAAEAALQEALQERERERERLERLGTPGGTQGRRDGGAAERETAERETADGGAAQGGVEGGTTPVTAAAFGVVPLRQALPEIFGQLVEEYGAVLDLGLEQRGFRVEHALPARMRRLAERLGFLRAGPRDAVDVHVAALRRRTQEATAQRAKAYLEEGRLAVLELMGDLAAYYRGRAA